MERETGARRGLLRAAALCKYRTQYGQHEVIDEYSKLVVVQLLLAMWI